MVKQIEHKIPDLEVLHRFFMLEEIDLKPKFFLGIFCHTQVPAGQLWQLYRDGVFYDQLKAGPHNLWNGLWHTWKAHVINLRAVNLPFAFEGRVRGPDMSNQSAVGSDLDCTIQAEVTLVCKIANIEKYLEYETPLTIFYATLRNMVVELISKLPYDQFGGWARTLSDDIREHLQGGRNDSVSLIGIRVEQVYVTVVQPNSLHDRNMLEMYQQVELTRRELVTAQENRKRDKMIAESYAKQGEIMNIAPSILALQNSPIGKALIERDADLKKLIVAAGLNPSINIQAIPDPQAQMGKGLQSSSGYLNAPEEKSQKFFDRLNNPICFSTDHSDMQYTRYTDISCPRRVWIQTKRVSVIVRLTKSPSAYSEVVEPLSLHPDIPVRVHLDAPGFTILNAFEQEVVFPSGNDSMPLVFDLQPCEVVHTHIIVDFFQAGNLVGTASVPVEIMLHEVNISNTVQAGIPLYSGVGITPPDYYLSITYEQSLTSPTLTFALRRATESIERPFAPIFLKQSPEVYATALYQRLTQLTNRINPTAYTALHAKKSLHAEEIDDFLREEGNTLWRTLIPQELQDLYASERDQWHNRSLLIVSDEPHIPWELLWPFDPRGSWCDDVPLCLHLNIARWLRRGSQGTPNPHPVPNLYLNALGVIVPSDSGLQAAQQEYQFLKELINQHGLKDVSPAEPTFQAIKHLLRYGNYTWLHVAAHGNFHSSDTSGEAAIWLEGQQPFRAQAITGEIEIYLRKQRPAFVLNACEVGRLGWSITGIGGWANQLIQAGAGLFLAPMWNVTDKAALVFSQSLYYELLNGKTIGEAVRYARLAARSQGNPSWLAYSLYAHPNARIVK